MVATGLLIQRAFGNDIQVSGHQEFPESRWREAILFFLFGIWGDQQSVTRRPKIIFGSVTIRLDSSKGEYYAYGVAADDLHDMPSVPEGAHLEVGCQQAEVELGLVRFVKNDRIRTLTLKLGPGLLCLWKKQRRGEYGMASWGIPNSWGGLSPA